MRNCELLSLEHMTVKEYSSKTVSKLGRGRVGGGSSGSCRVVGNTRLKEWRCSQVTRKVKLSLMVSFLCSALWDPQNAGRNARLATNKPQGSETRVENGSLNILRRSAILDNSQAGVEMCSYGEPSAHATLWIVMEHARYANP